MLKDYRYQEEDILASINYLRDQGGKRFDFNDLDDTRKFYKGTPKGNWDPKTVFSKKDVLIIGTGLEFRNHEKAIECFIERKKPVVLAINTNTISKNNLIDIRIASHPKRLFSDIDKHLKLPQPLIIPSQLVISLQALMSSCNGCPSAAVLLSTTFDVSLSFVDVL